MGITPTISQILPNIYRYIDIPLIFSIIMMPNFGSDLVNNAMKSEELKEFLKIEKRFDVCIMELITGDALLVNSWLCWL